MAIRPVVVRHHPLCWTSPPPPPPSPPHRKKMPEEPWSNDRPPWMSRNQRVNVCFFRREGSPLIVLYSSELILRDSTNAGCKSEGSPIHSVQKRQQKKKKRRTANSYSDVSFNDKYKLTEELLGTGAHGYIEVDIRSAERSPISLSLFARVVKTCRDRVTKQEYAVKVCSFGRGCCFFLCVKSVHTSLSSTMGLEENERPRGEAIAMTFERERKRKRIYAEELQQKKWQRLTAWRAEAKTIVEREGQRECSLSLSLFELEEWITSSAPYFSQWNRAQHPKRNSHLSWGYPISHSPKKKKKKGQKFIDSREKIIDSLMTFPSDLVHSNTNECGH